MKELTVGRHTRTRSERVLRPVSDTAGTAMLVVCPPPTGGHVEHAHALSAAVADLNPDTTVELLSRRGAGAYLGSYLHPRVRVTETIPDVSPRKSTATGAARTLWRGVLEHVAVVAAVHRAQPTVVVLEEPRYAFPGLFRLARPTTRVILILHNVTPHEDGHGRSWLGRLRGRLSMACERRVDVIVTHGARQRERAMTRSTTTVTTAVLPGRPPVTAAPLRPVDGLRPGTFLCLGELRPNKGLLTAAASSGPTATVSIVGRVVDEELAARLTAAAEASPYTVFRPGFLTVEQFEHALRSARALLVPYEQFDAHSDIVARARLLGLPLVASDLPALVEQLGDHEPVEIFRAGDPYALRAALERMDARLADGAGRGRPPQVSVEASRALWADYATVVTGCSAGPR